MPFFKEYPVVLTTDIGEIRFNDPTDLGDLPADLAFIDGLPGWTQTVTPRAVTSPRAVGDGANISSKFYSDGRLLMLEGMVATDSDSETETAWNELVRVGLPLNKDIIVTHEGPVPKFCTVRVISPVRPTQFMPQGFRFEVDLMSEDSYLYDATNTLMDTAGIVGNSSGGMTFPMTFPLDFNPVAAGEGNEASLFNLGNAETYPTIQITGPLDNGWRLENVSTGEFISFDASLVAGQVLTIDHKTETASIDGSSVTGLVDGDWFPLTEGLNIIRLYGNYNASAFFTVTAKSAWR